MRRHLWLAGLATLASISGVNAAQDIEVVANSILRAYSDYCDPLFFEQNRAADAPFDPALAHSYARVLFTRDGGQCDRFHNTEVAPAAIVPRLIGQVPELQRSKSRTLTELQVGILGSILRYDDMTKNECDGQAQDTSDISDFRAVAEPWWTAVGRDDALDLAKGYIGAELFARVASGLPVGGGTATPCSARELVAGMITLAAVNGGLTPPRPSANGMSTQEFDQLMSQPSAPPRGANGEDGPGVSADAPIDGYVWEAGDPASKRGGDEKPIDLTPYVSPTDAAAIAEFAGRWGTTPACDEPGEQIIVDGGDAPRIGGADLGCDLGGLQSFDDVVTFDATCVGEGDDWRGQGSIQPSDADAIDLFLFGKEEPQHLVRCGSNVEAQASSDGGIGDLPLDWDGSWVKSVSGGSEIEIPSFLQRGPIRALMNGDVDYGTAFDGSDGISLSLRQYRVDTRSSPHQWLREGAASDVVVTTYEVDKADFGVISGYMDRSHNQAYYGICRQGRGELQCVDMFWSSRDQDAVEPLIERVVRSLQH